MFTIKSSIELNVCIDQSLLFNLFLKFMCVVELKCFNICMFMFFSLIFSDWRWRWSLILCKFYTGNETFDSKCSANCMHSVCCVMCTIIHKLIHHIFSNAPNKFSKSGYIYIFDIIWWKCLSDFLSEKSQNIYKD